MGELNLSQSEHEALKAIDTGVLARLLEQCLRDVRADALGVLPLGHCGLYISTKLRHFRQALLAHAEARSTQKRAEMESCARLAGDDLRAAILHMKYRAEAEREEALLFKVDDMITPPFHYSQPVRVRVRYEWRQTSDGQWQHGSITFSHIVDLEPNYALSAPKRKPSAAARDREKQDKLCRNWEQLKSLALQAVRDYFREGGDGASIPSAFDAKPDAYTRGLNNYSAQFWAKRESQPPKA
ncbi:hypothetical protein DF142_17235 [Burkholderia cenocepacia]|uniref:hypothetical protein n=1 Tax=Burkholderia cenocepacia TaxID=95486 RepID=UPI000F568F0F|nr:hypothetical protein [Burkholderia cenocepacia]RQU40852.1 hypothetical protein DF142_17235 [Burkholderia cenocepacia]RQU70283.1 hypothetical protein DF140_06770 [Burkholderia cenocepacia]